jgi:AraC-like DNA-binding protein
VRYAEYLPSPSLREFVRCYWIVEAPACTVDEPPERIVPDGCSELIVHHGDPYSRLDPSGRPLPQRRALFAGQIEGPLLLRPTGAAGMFAVRFQPAGAAAFVDLPLCELRGRIVELSALWTNAGELEERLREADGDADRVAIVERALVARLALADPRTGAVDAAVRRIVDSRGQEPVDRLARRLGVGRRRLERGFRELVGLPPKRLARIVRFQTALQLAESGGHRWAQLALQCGFADQAHLIRDFRAFAGLSPARYLAERPGTDLFQPSAATG